MLSPSTYIFEHLIKILNVSCLNLDCYEDNSLQSIKYKRNKM